MRINPWRYFPGWLLLCFVLFFQGCAEHEVRHLSSDASLVTPSKTTRQEVLALLGHPDEKTGSPEQGEVWRYYQVNKSFMRQTPYVGKKLGKENYDSLTITIENGIVKSSIFRNFDENEKDRPVIREQDEAGRDK